MRWILLLCLLLPCPATADWGTLDADRDGYTTDEGDCNDGDPEINPGAREICDDAIDNDCDTTVDFEDPQCSACGSCHVAEGSTAGGLGVLLLGAALWCRVRRGARGQPCAPARPGARPGRPG